ncbi:radical SAM protein [archaeon]|jgi:radical SAM superfamily enzyme YgiQ (UPF0313 family)|nr:radical SAM protein [archaeon]MBT4397612.1 radical SAM protein [archaeon]MBT4441089.1 radical SAM protein [archaeon]
MADLILDPAYKREDMQDLYPGGDMNAPLAEQTSNVVQLELTKGCSWNKCSYCGLFETTKFGEMDYYDFRVHASQVFKALGRRGELDGLTRLFIGSGDALSVETEKLQKAIQGSINEFWLHTQRVPKRVAMYASVPNVLTKTVEDLNFLHCGGSCYGGCSKDDWGERIGLELIYLGLETGDGGLLPKLNKNYTEKDMYEAIKRLRKAGTVQSDINVSAFVMPGLGGENHRQSHIQGTLDALRMLRPKFINIMTISEDPKSRYKREMDREVEAGTNRRLTEIETSEQIADLVEGLDFETTIGCFDNSMYLGRDSNKVKFRSVKIDPVLRETHKKLADRIRTAAQTGETEVSVAM